MEVKKGMSNVAGSDWRLVMGWCNDIKEGLAFTARLAELVDNKIQIKVDQ